MRHVRPASKSRAVQGGALLLMLMLAWWGRRAGRREGTGRQAGEQAFSGPAADQAGARTTKIPGAAVVWEGARSVSSAGFHGSTTPDLPSGQGWPAVKRPRLAVEEPKKQLRKRKDGPQRRAAVPGHRYPHPLPLSTGFTTGTASARAAPYFRKDAGMWSSY